MLKVRYTKPNVFVAEGVRLLPGINTISAEKADAFLANAGVKKHMQMSQIEVIQGAADPVKEVAETHDVAKLREMAAGDKRKAEVKAAIAKLEEIDSMGKDDE